MSTAAWIILAVGSLLCGESMRKTFVVWQMDTAERWVVPVMALCSAAQVLIFGYLVWVSL